jgi:hypothetical protein
LNSGPCICMQVLYQLNHVPSLTVKSLYKWLCLSHIHTQLHIWLVYNREQTEKEGGYDMFIRFGSKLWYCVLLRLTNRFNIIFVCDVFPLKLL